MGPAPPPRHENDLLEADRLPNLRGWEFRPVSRVTPRAPELFDCAPDLGGRAPNIPSLSSYRAAPPVSWRAAPPRGFQSPSANLGSTPIHRDGSVSHAPRVTCQNQTKRYPTARGNRERGCYGCVSVICGIRNAYKEVADYFGLGGWGWGFIP